MQNGVMSMLWQRVEGIMSDEHERGTFGYKMWLVEFLVVVGISIAISAFVEIFSGILQ